MSTVQRWIASLAEEATLGSAAAKVVEVLATHPNLASYATTAELAERAGVNVATVVRTARQLGFTGWPALRVEVRGHYLASLSATEVSAEHDTTASDTVSSSPRHPSLTVLEAIRRDIENLGLLSRTVDTDALCAVARSIHEASKTVVVGSGSYAAPGLQLAHIGTTMGREIQLERHFGTQLANTVNRLDEHGCLVAFNFWWLPKQVLEATALARERGATTCVVTDRHSQLSDAADHVVFLPSEGVSSFPSLTPAMTAVHAILAELTRLGGDEARAAVAQTEAVWAEMSLFTHHD